MAAVAEARANTHLVHIDDWNARKKKDALLKSKREEKPELTDDETAELEIARFCLQMLRDGQRARQPYETFDDAWALFIGDVWPAKYPVWKARITINKIRSFLLFMQAIMTDQKPRVSVMPLVPGTEAAARLMNKLVDRSWDETGMQKKIALAVLYGLIWGTGFLKITYDPLANNEQGRHEAAAVVPYRIYTNPTATSVEDARYIIHIEDQTLGYIAEKFPDKYNIVRKFKNARVDTEMATNRDFIREGFGQQRLPLENAVRTAINNIMQDNGRPSKNVDDNETVEVAEFWFRDETTETYERQVIKGGVPQMKDAVDEDGMPIVKIGRYEQAASPIDGLPYMRPVYVRQQEPMMELARRAMFPNGRLVIMAGPVVMCDIANPYQIDGFPFAMWKNLDVGAFFGQGEPLNMKDPQIALNRILSQIFDILEKIGNPMLKYKKGMGLETRSLRNKPGSIIPLEELNALEPLNVAPIQQGFFDFTNTIDKFFGGVANLPDVAMGGSPGGNTAFATVDSLQESAAAPVRQKVRNMEEMISRAGKLRIQLIQQFDRGDRPIRERIDNVQPTPIYDEEGEILAIPQPASAVEIQFTKFTNAELQGPLEFSVVPDSSLSVSPAGVRSLYLQLFDKHIVDQQAVLEKLNIDDMNQIMKRMQTAAAAAAQAKKKPGPKPKGKPQAQPTQNPSQVPGRQQVSALR